jgi:hypothetical protein
MNNRAIMKRCLVFTIIILMLLVNPSLGETVPPNKWIFNDDYFTVYGSPEMVVSIVGNSEYNRDETSTLLVRIMNQGKILGFKSENEPEDANEIALSKIEQQQEYDVTTAVGITASVLADEAPIDIKTPPQGAGTLLSGQVSQPLQFEIKIWDSAPAGTYPLKVNLTYQYQKDVQVEGNVTINEIDYNMLYEQINESHDITIIVKKQADFETTEAVSDLLPGTSDIISITFKNTGEEIARGATARLRLSDPFSSTDYTAFLGDMEPDNEVQALFNIDVDSDATAKTYSVKTEIEYEDVEGKIKISDTIYVPVRVTEQEGKGGIFQNPFLLAGAVLVVGILVYFYMKKRAGGIGSEE